MTTLIIWGESFEKTSVKMLSVVFFGSKTFHAPKTFGPVALLTSASNS